MTAKVKSRVKLPSRSRNRSRSNGLRPPKQTAAPQISSHAADVVSLSKGLLSPAMKPADMLALQATIGNAAVNRMVGSHKTSGLPYARMGSTGRSKVPTVQATTSMNHDNGNGLIQRAPAGDALVIEKTHLRKSNKAGTAPRKLPSIFNQVGKAIKKNSVIELLEVEVKAGKNVTWQKAKHPDTDKIGFVRMSKVLATGKEPPSEIETPAGSTGVEKVAKLTKTLTGIVNGGSKIGTSVGTMLSASSKTEKDLAQVMLTKPEFANKWFLFGEKAGEDEAEALVESDLYNIEDVINKEWQTGFKAGGLATGAVGEVGGAIGGFLGMIQGLKKYHKSKGKVSDTVDMAVSQTTGSAGLVGGGLGALSKISGFVGAVTKSDTVKSISTSLQGTLGFFGSGLKTVKGAIETVVKVVKALKSGFASKGKSAWAKIKDFVEATADIAGSALGTVKSAIMTVVGVLKLLKSLPLFSSILGIVGSVIDLVTGALNLIKTIYDSVKLVVKLVKEFKLVKELKKDHYAETEARLPEILLDLEKAVLPPGKSVSEKDLEKNEEGIPTVKQQETTLAKYRQSDEGKQTEDYYADKVETHLVDQGLINTVKKRIKKAFWTIPGLIMDAFVSVVSIGGGLVSIGADIAAVASAPTGVGTAVAVATKTIASTVTTVLTGSAKLIKTAFGIGRIGVRKIKQYARDKGLANTNQDKTTAKKVERRKNTVKSLMMSVYDLEPAFFDFEKDAKRAQLRMEATGVDTVELYEKNGDPKEQAKMLMKALDNTG
jgi:hypothetical protein